MRTFSNLLLLAPCWSRFPGPGTTLGQEPGGQRRCRVAGTGAVPGPQRRSRTLPGWTTTGSLQQCLYTMGVADSRWMKIPGKQHFAGGPNGGPSTAKQIIDLAASATEIDAGRVRFFSRRWLSNGGSNSSRGKVTRYVSGRSGKTLLEYSVDAPRSPRKTAMPCTGVTAVASCSRIPDPFTPGGLDDQGDEFQRRDRRRYCV